jgi:hypothetical protein
VDIGLTRGEIEWSNSGFLSHCREMGKDGSECGDSGDGRQSVDAGDRAGRGAYGMGTIGRRAGQ